MSFSFQTFSFIRLCISLFIQTFLTHPALYPAFHSKLSHSSDFVFLFSFKLFSLIRLCIPLFIQNFLIHPALYFSSVNALLCCLPSFPPPLSPVRGFWIVPRLFLFQQSKWKTQFSQLVVPKYLWMMLEEQKLWSHYNYASIYYAYWSVHFFYNSFFIVIAFILAICNLYFFVFVCL